MSIPDPIEPMTRYRVEIKRPVKVGVLKMLPRDAHDMTGAFLQKLITEHGADAIRSATAIE